MSKASGGTRTVSSANAAASRTFAQSAIGEANENIVLKTNSSNSAISNLSEYDKQDLHQLLKNATYDVTKIMSAINHGENISGNINFSDDRKIFNAMLMPNVTDKAHEAFVSIIKSAMPKDKFNKLSNGVEKFKQEVTSTTDKYFANEENFKKYYK